MATRLDYADWSSVPEHVQGGLRRYLEHGLPPGRFLSAVLSNDLREACECADDINRHRLFDIVSFLYNSAPHGSWGSPEAYRAWVQRGGLNRNESAAA